MPSNRNETATKRFFDEVMNEGHLDVIPQIMADDYTLQGQSFPPTKTREWAEGLRKQFPKLKFTLEGLIAEGDQVAVWWELDLGGELDGRRAYSGINMLTFDERGKCKTNWQGNLSKEVIPRIPKHC